MQTEVRASTISVPPPMADDPSGGDAGESALSMTPLRFCSNCGEQALRRASFCGSCGNVLTSDGEQSSDVPDDHQPYPSRAATKDQPGPGWWRSPSGKWFAPNTPPFVPRAGAVPRGSPGSGYWQDPDSQWHPPSQPPFHPSQSLKEIAPPLLNPDELLAGRGKVDPRILRKLNESKSVAQCHCLECGYSGLMPMDGEKRPWWGSWWILIPICLTGIGIVAVAIYALLVASSSTQFYICPNCGRRLASK
jgi:predicted RNA-binding Zn-ribbon protein involved in translation (DUF1610 family)